MGSTEALVELELEASRMLGPWKNRERLKALFSPQSDDGLSSPPSMV